MRVNYTYPVHDAEYTFPEMVAESATAVMPASFHSGGRRFSRGPGAVKVRAAVFASRPRAVNANRSRTFACVSSPFYPP
jgi:hypothetical protein